MKRVFSFERVGCEVAVAGDVAAGELVGQHHGGVEDVGGVVAGYKAEGEFGVPGHPSMSIGDRKQDLEVFRNSPHHGRRYCARLSERFGTKEMSLKCAYRGVFCLLPSRYRRARGCYVNNLGQLPHICLFIRWNCAPRVDADARQRDII